MKPLQTQALLVVSGWWQKPNLRLIAHLACLGSSKCVGGIFLCCPRKADEAVRKALPGWISITKLQRNIHLDIRLVRILIFKTQLAQSVVLLTLVWITPLYEKKKIMTACIRRNLDPVPAFQEIVNAVWELTNIWYINWKHTEEKFYLLLWIQRYYNSICFSFK